MSLDVAPQDAPLSPSIVARLRTHRTAVLVCLVFAVALALRTVPSLEHTFDDEGVWFSGQDGWFHMRTVRNLVQHLPWRSGFDPYSAFPTGQPVTTGPFFDYAIALTAWTLGLGRPGEHLVDTVGAWVPPVLGALVCIVAFFAGRTLFGTLAGLFAAALVAVYPGLWFLLSRLGFTDHHVMEALLSSLALLFLVRAMRAAHPWRDTAFAGLFLGSLLLTRPAAAFVVAIISAWVVVQGALQHLRGLSNDRLTLVATSTLAIATIFFLPVRHLVWGEFATLAVAAGLGIAITPALLTRLLDRLSAPGWMFPVVLAAAAAVVGVAGVTLRPDLARALVDTIATRVFDARHMVLELRPLLAIEGAYSLAPAWREFTSSWILALPALTALVARIPRQDAALNLFTIWSAAMLCLALAQYRMAIYLVLPMAVLTGMAGCRLMETDARRRIVAVTFVAFVIAPNLWYVVPEARRQTSTPADWRDALLWLRDRTPEPMGAPEAYDAYYSPRPPGVPFVYPPGAYGVMNWWEHGHWITAVARRIPVSNGMHTNLLPATRFYLSTDPASAIALLDEIGVRYVVADGRQLIPKAEDLQQGLGALLTMPEKLGEDRTNYCEVLFEPQPDGSHKPFFVFKPAYFRTTLVRLWLFDGRATSARAPTWVFSYRNREDVRGVRIREVSQARRFSSYAEAEAFRAQFPDEPMIVGGREPLGTIVPLEEFAGLRLVYTSLTASGVPGAVKIFLRERP
jgi:oligosaccharyl transferase (archaeosortase A-associated)